MPGSTRRCRAIASVKCGKPTVWASPGKNWVVRPGVVSGGKVRERETEVQWRVVSLVVEVES